MFKLNWYYTNFEYYGLIIKNSHIPDFTRWILSDKFITEKKVYFKEFQNYFRNLSSIFLPLIFFFLIISIFPLLIGPDKVLLNKIVPGIVWITIIFTTLLSSNNFFKDDYNNGYLETFLTSDSSVEFILFLKIISCWLFTCFPIILFIPLVSIFFNISIKDSFIFISRLLYFTQTFIIEVFPGLEFYLNYFFESMRNVFEIWKSLIINY